jgi:hypothetical protein
MGDMTEYGGGYDPPKSMAGPLFIGLLVQAGALLAWRLSTSPFDGDWPLFLGKVTGASLPIPFLLWLFFMRRRDPGGWWKPPILFWPLSFVILFGAPGARTYQDEQYGLALNSLIAASGQRLEDGREIGALPRSRAAGEAGEIERLVLDAAEQDLAERRVFLRELHAADFRQPLTHDHIPDRDALPAARARLEAARAVVARARRQSEARMAVLARRIDAALMSEPNRAALRDGFGIGAQNGRGWDLEARRLDAYGAVLDILGRTRWSWGRSFIGFFNQADVATFNESIRALNGANWATGRMAGARQDRIWRATNLLRR